MSQRTDQECHQDLQDNTAIHIANAAQRDNFIALAHTALFAASIAFIGDVVPVGQAAALPLLYLGWSTGVLGLLAITASFPLAERAINAHRQAVYLSEAPRSAAADWANRIALYTFPVSLVALVLFASINISTAKGTVMNKEYPGDYEKRGITPPARVTPPTPAPAPSQTPTQAPTSPPAPQR